MYRIAILFLFGFLLLFSCEKKPEAGSTTGVMNGLEGIISRVDALFTGLEHQVHCLYIENEFTLSFWVVAQEIDPDATEHDFPAQCEKAIKRALELSTIILDAVPEVRTTFDSINPMIADKKLNSWYLDFIPVTLLPAELDLFERSHDLDQAYLRSRQPLAADFTPFYTRNPAVMKLLRETSSSGFVASYLVVQDFQPTVQLYLTSKSQAAKNDKMVSLVQGVCNAFGSFLDSLDLIEVYFLDQGLRLQALAKVRCRKIRDQECRDIGYDSIDLYFNKIN